MKNKPKLRRWEACVLKGHCMIPIGRRGSPEAPICVCGKSIKSPEAFARKIARLLNESEK